MVKLSYLGLKRKRVRFIARLLKIAVRDEIYPLINKACKTSTVYTDGFKTYDGLVDMGYKKHYRVHHGKNEFAKKQGDIKNHINGIENFWGLAKVRLAKFRGMHKNTFYLHLKECEFRFNYRDCNIYKMLLKMMRQNPLN